MCVFSVLCHLKSADRLVACPPVKSGEELDNKEIPDRQAEAREVLQLQSLLQEQQNHIIEKKPATSHHRVCAESITLLLLRATERRGGETRSRAGKQNNKISYDTRSRRRCCCRC